MSKMANQVSCLILMMILQLCLVSCTSDFFNYFHTYYHNHKRQSTSEAVPSSTSGYYSSTEKISTLMTRLSTTKTTAYSEAAASSPVEYAVPSAGSSTEENVEIFVTQKSYSSEEFYSYQKKWLMAARIIAIGGGIFLFISLFCCIGCYCRGGCHRERAGMIIGQSPQSPVSQTHQTVAAQQAPFQENMQPPPPPYSEEKSQQLPYYQNTAYLPPGVEQQFQYSPNLHNPPTAPPPYQDRY